MFRYPNCLRFNPQMVNMFPSFWRQKPPGCLHGIVTCCRFSQTVRLNSILAGHLLIKSAGASSPCSFTFQRVTFLVVIECICNPEIAINSIQFQIFALSGKTSAKG